MFLTIKYKVKVLVPLLILLLCNFFLRGQVPIANKSFEGISPPLTFNVPPLWTQCWGSPDIQPGGWCVTLPPSNGKAYIGIGAQLGNGAERIGQYLAIPIQKDKTYKITADLSMTNSKINNCGGFNPGLVTFELWSGNCSCCRSKLLAKVDTINHVGWRTYSLIFKADSTYSYFLMQSNALPPVLSSRYLLIDNLSNFKEVKIWYTSSDIETLSCTSQFLKGRTDSLVSKVKIKSTLLNQTVQAQLLNDTTWQYDGFTYPVYCEQRTDTLIAYGYFPNGTVATDKLIVNLNCANESCDLYIPNLITPNKDNKNDFFEIEKIPVNHQLEIYNRWGQRIYENTDYKNDWQGEEDGVYYYLLFTEYKTYKGWVQVIR